MDEHEWALEAARFIGTVTGLLQLHDIATNKATRDDTTSALLAHSLETVSAIEQALYAFDRKTGAKTYEDD